MSNEFKAPNGIDFMSQKGVNVADGSNPGDAVNKSQLDSAVNGLSWKTSVRAATTANGTLATAYANGQSIDGVTLVTGDRILIKDQSSGAENGIYVVAASGAPARASDADTATKVKNMTVMVNEGTANAGKAFTQTVDTAITLGTTALAFANVGGGVTYLAGNGLTGSTTFSVLANGTGINVSGSGIRLDDTVAGAGLVPTSAGSGLLKVGQGTGIVVNSDDVSIDTSTVTRKYTTITGAVTGGSPVTITHNLGNKYVMCQVFIESTGEGVLIPPFLVDANSLTLTFNVSQSSGYYRVVVQG